MGHLRVTYGLHAAHLWVPLAICGNHMLYNHTYIIYGSHGSPTGHLRLTYGSHVGPTGIIVQMLVILYTYFVDLRNFFML